MSDFDPSTSFYPAMAEPPAAPAAPVQPSAAPAPALSEEGAAMLSIYPSMQGEILADEGIAEPPPTEEAATEETTTSEGDAPPPQEAQPPPAIVPPEGMTVDPQAFEAFTKLATDAGVAPEVASAMLQLHADQLAAVDYGRQEQATVWAEEARADPTIGGARFEATIKSARAVLGTYGDAELREALDRSGLGNHKSVIRLLAKVGEAIEYHRALSK